MEDEPTMDSILRTLREMHAREALLIQKRHPYRKTSSARSENKGRWRPLSFRLSSVAHSRRMAMSELNPECRSDSAHRLATRFRHGKNQAASFPYCLVKLAVIARPDLARTAPGIHVAIGQIAVVMAHGCSRSRAISSDPAIMPRPCLLPIGFRYCPLSQIADEIGPIAAKFNPAFSCR